VFAFERRAERERVAVPDAARHRLQGRVALAQQVGGLGEADAGQVRHGRLADQLREPLRERRAGRAHLGGEAGDRPGARRVVVQEPQGGAHDRVAVGAVPAGRPGVRPGEPRAQRADEQQVEQPVEDDLLAGLVPADLLAEQPRQRRPEVLAADDRQRREGGQQPPRDRAAHPVGADQHDGRPVRVVAPGADAEVHRPRQARPVRGGAALLGVDDDLRLGAGGVGDRVRGGPPEDRDVAGGDAPRLAAVHGRPRVVADHRHERERRLVLDADRPRRAERRAQQERASCPGPVQQVGQGVHGPSVDARVWRRVSRRWWPGRPAC